MWAEADMTIADRNLGGVVLETDRATIGHETRRATLPFDDLDRRCTAHDINEVLDLARNVEADVITLQPAADDRAPPRHHVEHLTRRDTGTRKSVGSGWREEGSVD